MYTTLSSKGQVTIPVEIRNVLRLNTGDRIDFVVFDKGRVEMIPKNNKKWITISDEVLAIGGDKLLVGDDVKSASVSATGPETP